LQRFEPPKSWRATCAPAPPRRPSAAASGGPVSATPRRLGSEQRHDLGHWIVELAEPRAIPGPPLVPDGQEVEMLVCGDEAIVLR